MSLESVIAQLKDLAANATVEDRVKIDRALQDVQQSIESPQSSITRMGNAYLQLVIAKIGIKSGLFAHLISHADGPLSVDQVAKAVGGDSELWRRLLRYLASVGFVHETEKDHFQANKYTFILCNPACEGFIDHGFETAVPIIQSLPDYLANTGYSSITSNTRTPFNAVYNTDMTHMDWLATQPRRMAHLQKLMTATKSDDWLEASVASASSGDGQEQGLLTEADIQSWIALQQSHNEPPKPYFIDVGGGHGHQVIGLRDRYPHRFVPSTTTTTTTATSTATSEGNELLVLQDLPTVISSLSPISGIKIVGTNFFTDPQPIKGAKYYYLRRVLHDYPDTNCLTILKGLRDAIVDSGSRDVSRVLIDEMVLPDTGVAWQATFADLNMMISVAGKERTGQEWEELAKKAGFSVERTVMYDNKEYKAVQVWKVV